MQLKKIKRGIVTIGDELPWAVYDEAGTLLLKKGYTIPNDRQLVVITSNGYYWDEIEEEFSRKVHPFEKIKELQVRLNRVIERFRDGTDRESAVNELDEVVNILMLLCSNSPDVMIGAVHLFNDRPYSITHLLHISIVTALQVNDLKLSPHTRKMSVAAALTCNLSMMSLHELLEQQKTPLTDAQREDLKLHPKESVEILESFKISDPTWLESVLHHHESVDGTGYPHGLSGDAIPITARVIAVADCYCALVKHKTYRKGYTPSTVLKHFFKQKGQKLDEELSLRLIKMFGIYPPGTYVKLANGESAIVIQRSGSAKSMWPIVRSYRSATGPYLAELLSHDSAEEKFKIKEVMVPETHPHEYDEIWEVDV
ncbi:MAG: HD domain-containing protein [Gammaproteobacteria bacterium]|nr:HD domain-containing protein [Gammaproteobacteria bacterium]